MKLQDLQQKYRTLLDQARKLVDEWAAKGEDMPEEVQKQVDGLLGESDVVKTQIEIAQKLEAGEAYLSEPSGPPQAAKLDWRPAGPSEGDTPVDPKAWREVEVSRMTIDPVIGVPVSVTQKIRFNIPLAVQGKGYPAAFEAYLHKGFGDLGPEDRKTLTEGVDSAGGFLTPEDYITELIRKIATMATIRARARVAQTSRDIAKWPKVQYTTDDKYTSGVRMTWTGESPASATVHRVTDPVFGLYSIPIHTGMASMPLSNDLLEDSAFDVIGISQDMFSEAYALGENDAFLNGNGIARPMGLLTQVDGDGPASVNSGDASTLTADGLVNLWAALPSQYESNAAWTFSKATEGVIRKLREDEATPAGLYMWPVYQAVGALGPAPRELLGFPIMRDEFMPAIAGNAFPILFGDLRGYLILDRVGLSIQRLTELYAETNVTLLLARKRVGGQTIEPWRIKVQKVAA